MRIMSRLLLAFLLPCLAFQATAESTAPKLHRGINLSSWLANAPRQPLFARDFMLLKTAGFDHVRLPFDPEYFGFALDGNHDPASVNFLPLDRAIGLGMGHGLAVVLDMHPGMEFVEKLETSAKAREQFIALWVTMAERYKKQPIDMLAFALLNEPQYYHKEDRYAAFARQLVAAVRKVEPSRMLIVGAPQGSSIEGLLKVEPVNDTNIAYDFHFYEPYIITHQGIRSGFDDKMIRYFRKLPYPSALVTGNAGAYTVKAANPMQAQSELDEYVNANWHANHIAERIGMAKAWADAKHVRILCGEFGVLREHIDSQSRYRWIGDVRKALEANRIGWEVWDYTDGFGIARLHGKTATDPDGAIKFVDPARGSRMLEPQALAALGLRK